MVIINNTTHNDTATATTINNVNNNTNIHYTANDTTNAVTMNTTTIPTTNNISTNHPIVGDRVIEGTGTSTETWLNWHGLNDLAKLDINQFTEVSTCNPNAVQPARICVFAPHPDDEILGCAGLLQQLAAADLSILIIYVTDGAQSHPDSAIYPPEKLKTIRPNESVHAIKTLGISNYVSSIALHLDDGNVFNQQAQFTQKLSDIIKPNDILITPFVHDGHPDHEATGQVVTTYANRYNLACYQVLIWAWHWAKPADKRIPWHNAKRLDLTPMQVQHKIAAIYCFNSQITTDQSTGNAPILSTTTIRRLSQPWEVYIYEPNY